MEKVIADMDLSPENADKHNLASFDANNFYADARYRMDERLKKIRGADSEENLSFMTHMAKKMSSENIRM